ncbi:DNA-binding LacI/PurR family transcriptional regulator [Paenibacillus endophyticus]|uniref:DNA-binding LacI/PurR family transcriptional regulator n=1 Tax=Paenibacillus endophyticus TaxID=1294268 RepID=A0A7W5CDK2_9BACL|nr:DNA-binding LacI/PurR family transcriptional regulator [Paenibacillus endophyticus]
MSKEKVTIQQIADSLGLSRNTVSKALNGMSQFLRRLTIKELSAL